MNSPDLFPAIKSLEELQFSNFYAEKLEFASGARTKAQDILDSYMTWARDNRCHGLGFKDLKRHLAKQGHRHRYSNGSYYLDCQFRDSENCSEVPANLQPPATMQQIDLLKKAIRALKDLADAMT